MSSDNETRLFGIDREKRNSFGFEAGDDTEYANRIEVFPFKIVIAVIFDDGTEYRVTIRSTEYHITIRN
jgi:hypothetical protein